MTECIHDDLLADREIGEKESTGHRVRRLFPGQPPLNVGYQDILASKPMSLCNRPSLGGWVFIIHFATLSVLWITYYFPPQFLGMTMSVGNESWREIHRQALICMGAPASLFMSHWRVPYAFWAGKEMILLFVILALNSLMIGYGVQWLIRFTWRAIFDNREYDWLRQTGSRDDSSPLPKPPDMRDDVR